MKDITKALLIGLSSRIVVLVVTILSSYLFSFASTQWLPLQANTLPVVSLFNRWDSQFYTYLAAYGYPLNHVEANHIMDAVTPYWAFFPLYPAVTRALGTLFSPALPLVDSMAVSGFIISNVAFFVSVYFFYKLTNKLFNPKVALIATAFYSFFGGASFYSAIYSEALFMAFAVGAFYYLEENKLATATTLGFLASLTRSNGFLIFIPFAIYAIQTRKNKLQTLKLVYSSLIVALPYLLWNFVGFLIVGVFPVREIAHDLNWGVTPPLTEQFMDASPNVYYTIFFLVGLALMFLPAVYLPLSRLWSKSFKNIWVQERDTIKYWAFLPVTLYIILFKSNLYSTIRYAVPILPIYWVSAIIYTKNRAAGLVIFGVMTATLIIGSVLFETSGYYM